MATNTCMKMHNGMQNYKHGKYTKAPKVRYIQHTPACLQQAHFLICMAANILIFYKELYIALQVHRRHTVHLNIPIHNHRHVGIHHLLVVI